MIDFIRRKGALTRWLTTRHIIGEYAMVFNESRSGTNSQNHNDSATNKKRDEADIMNIVDLVSELMN